MSNWLTLIESMAVHSVASAVMLAKTANQDNHETMAEHISRPSSMGETDEAIVAEWRRSK